MMLAPQTLPTAQPAAAAALDPIQQRAWKAAQDFEAVTLGAFLKPMFDTVDLSDGPMGGGEAEQTWQSMLVSEMGKQMQRAGGLGIARSVYTEMLRMQEQANPATRRRPAAKPGAQTGADVSALTTETLP